MTILYPMDYIEKDGKHIITSPSFPGLKGQKNSYDEAITSFLDQFHPKLNEIIAERKRLPEYYLSRKEMYEKRGQKSSCFWVSLEVGLKIKLYESILENKVTPEDLNQKVNVDLFKALDMKEPVLAREIEECMRGLGKRLKFQVIDIPQEDLN